MQPQGTSLVPQSQSQAPTATSRAVTMAPVSNERKWLGKNPEVVCFLLALENDRLMKENTDLVKYINELKQSSGGTIDQFNQLKKQYDEAMQQIGKYK